MRRGTAYRILLREAPQLKPLVAGYATSAFGDAAQSTALLWLAARPPLDSSRVAIIALAFIAPGAVAGPWISAIGDATRSRRDLLIGCDLALAVLAALLALLVAKTPFWTVVLDVALMGVIACLASATYAGALPEVVGTGHLNAANGLYRTTAQIAGIAGAATGGVLVATTGSFIVFLVNGATFVVSAVALTKVAGRRLLFDPITTERGDSSYTNALRSGWRFLRQSKPVALLAMVGVLGTIGFSPAQVVLVVLLRSQLHAGGAVYGGAQAMIWVGLSVGTVLAGSIRITSNTRLFGLEYLAVALFTLALGLAFSWWLALLCVLVRAGANGMSSLASRTLLQQHTPAAVRSGVVGTIGSIYEIPRIILLPITGLLISSVGVRLVYVGMAGFIAAAGLLALFNARALLPDTPDASEHVARADANPPTPREPIPEDRAPVTGPVALDLGTPSVETAPLDHEDSSASSSQ